MPLKKIAFWVVVIFFIFVINNLLHSIFSFSQKEDLIVKKEQELANAKKENARLKKQLAEAKKPQFVEKEARDKLFLAKPGEGVLMLASGNASKSSQAVIKVKESIPNWIEWYNLFFK